MADITRNIVVICGPTASGKTALAARIAHEFKLEIISADSRQVYRDLDIGSGKDLNEYIIDGHKIPYHMIDIEDPPHVYTLFDYQRGCFNLLRSQSGEKKPILMAGGSGLYIESVLRKYEISRVPEDLEFRQDMMKISKESLIKLLEEKNPVLHKKTDLSSKKRIVRSLEIHKYSKQGAADRSHANDINITPHIFCLNPSKEDLHKLIHQRLYARMDEGMIREVEHLLQKGVTFERLCQLGMEYKELALYLTGKKTREEMLADLERDIRRMAKSQMTYFRGMERRGLKVQWIKPHETGQIREYVSNLILLSDLF